MNRILTTILLFFSLICQGQNFFGDRRVFYNAALTDSLIIDFIFSNNHSIVDVLWSRGQIHDSTILKLAKADSNIIYLTKWKTLKTIFDTSFAIRSTVSGKLSYATDTGSTAAKFWKGWKVENYVTGYSVPLTKSSTPTIAPFSNNVVAKSIASTGDSMVIKSLWTHDASGGFSFIKVQERFSPTTTADYVWEVKMNSDFASYKSTILGIYYTGGFNVKSDVATSFAKADGTNNISLDPTNNVINLAAGGAYQVNSVPILPPAYGSLYFSSNTQATTLGTFTLGNSSTTWTWYEIEDVDLIAGDLLLTTTSAAAGTITLSAGAGGRYLICYSISGSSDQTGGDLRAGIEIDNVMKLNGTSACTYTAAAYKVTLSACMEINLAAGAVIDLAMAHVGAGNCTFTCNTMTLNVTRIGN